MSVNTQSYFKQLLHALSCLKKTQQEGEVERSACVDGGGGDLMSWSAFFGDRRCLIELRQVGLQYWAACQPRTQMIMC